MSCSFFTDFFEESRKKCIAIVNLTRDEGMNEFFCMFFVKNDQTPEVEKRLFL